MEQTIYIRTPIGRLGITATDRAVTRIFFADAAPQSSSTGQPSKDRACRTIDITAGTANASESGSADSQSHSADKAAARLLKEAETELTAYFAGKLQAFTFPIAPAGTEFQLAVWKALTAIPYGETRSYKQIAERISRPAASRAVGMANNRNPIVVVIPCHRVVGSDGSLIGYAGGLDKKRTLLALEKRQNAR